MSTTAALWRLLLLALLVAVPLLLMLGCVGTGIEGHCTYTREVKTVQQCEPDGKMRQLRVEPE